MSDQLTTRLLVAAGLTLVGVFCLAYTAWARRGRSERARAWMGSEFGERLRDEELIKAQRLLANGSSAEVHRTDEVERTPPV